MHVGETTHELDIAFALDREDRSEYEIKESLKTENLGSDFEPWVESGGRRLAFKESDDWVIDYTPVKYEIKLTPTVE
jgi:hypothetical protein